MRALVVALALALAAATAHASTQRIAVVVGNNAGSEGKTPLHFAEIDAAKLARVLSELGGVEPAHLFVLQGKPLTALGETLALVKRQIDEFRTDPANRVIVLFYFSGHSDGEALELGRDRLTFSELRRRLAALGADVRVVVVDSCKSGALLAAKGGKPGPGFQIRLTDELASTGEALLTSSAADEVALESREIAGSFFTHHFISGLRGAADASGDGLVTLTEAYQYAYAHTIKTTGETVVGTQHPAYDYRLSGQGELVLSELGKRSSILELPGGFDRIVVIELARDQVAAEVTANTHARIAVQAGRYAIRASRGEALFAVQVAVTDGSARRVREDELSAVPVAVTSRKGAAADAPSPLVVIAGGAGGGVANHLGVVPRVRIELVLPAGLSLALDASSRAGSRFRESSASMLAGYRRSVVRDAWSAWAGVEIGGGAVVQSGPYDGYSGVSGISLRLAPRLSVAIEATLPVELLKRDGKAALLAVPAGWLGISARL
ncbi:MAG TPA: caspase family protein [Kofleriaceae bacterium]|nr:caspase family protein [Kofleriaceae bacterium]